MMKTTKTTNNEIECGLICNNCGATLKQTFIDNGGISGHCNACDRIQWIIAPSVVKKYKLDIEYDTNYIPITEKEIQKYLKQVK